MKETSSERTLPESATPESATPEPATPEPAPLRIRYRVRFGKTGLLRWISHRDLATLWERLVRRARLNLSMTEGFHPKPRIAFPSALALGIESLDEVVELELAERLTPEQLLSRLVDDNQPGLTICSVTLLPDGFGKAQLAESDYLITPPEQTDLLSMPSVINEFRKLDSVEIQRKKKKQTFDIQANVRRLELVNGTLQLTLANTEGATLKPTDILDLMKLDDWIERGASVTRVQVRLVKEYENPLPEHSASSGIVPVAEATTRT